MVPAALFQHIHDDAALAVFDNFKQRRVRPMLEDFASGTAAYNVVGQQIDPDEWAVRQHDGALDHVFQFADVAWPSVIHDGTQGLGRNLARRLAVLGREPGQKVRDQQRDIAGTAAQRWQINGDYVQPVEQVFTEPAFAHQHLQIDIGGGDHADVNLDLLHAAEVHELLVLQDTQDFRLRFQAHGADFVEEDGAAVGDLEQAFLGRDRAGERALDVSEERGFQKVTRHGTGVHRDKWTVFARRVGVQSLGNQLFAGAALALYQHRRPTARDLEQHKIDGAFADLSQTLPAGLRRFHAVSFELQQCFQRLADGRFVVDDQDGSAGSCFHGMMT